MRVEKLATIGAFKDNANIKLIKLHGKNANSLENGGLRVYQL
jgi:hypothetical protein